MCIKAASCNCSSFFSRPFQPTSNERDYWVVPLFAPKNPWWSIILAILPALLATILIFMDQQITAVIVNRKENKLKVRLVYRSCHYYFSLFVSQNVFLRDLQSYARRKILMLPKRNRKNCFWVFFFFCGFSLEGGF